MRRILLWGLVLTAMIWLSACGGGGGGDAYAGSLGYSYLDLCSDDALGFLYLLNSSGTKKLLVLKQDNFFLQQSIELLGEPKQVFQTADKIIVITRNEESQAYYTKVFSKAQLGLK